MSTFSEFVTFRENYNRYEVHIFSVNYFFDGLSNDISHFVVAQNFHNLYMFQVCRLFLNLSIFSKIIIDGGLKFSEYTNSLLGF